MEVTAQVAAQVEAVSKARALAQVEEDSTVRVILVTKDGIIRNPTKVISNSSPDIRAIRSS